MQCVDCPDMPNGTNKRLICCRREGAALKRAQVEADIINALPAPPPLRAHTSIMTGTLLGSPAAAKFHPTSWSSGERRLRGRIIG